MRYRGLVKYLESQDKELKRYTGQGEENKLSPHVAQCDPELLSPLPVLQNERMPFTIPRAFTAPPC